MNGGKIKFKVFIGFVFFVCCLMPVISLAQNKVVVVPLMSDCDGIQTVTSAGQVWMDRNLGAHRVAKSRNDYQAYGWLYQWGRFADMHELLSSQTTALLSNTTSPGHSYFITTNSVPYDWMVPQFNNLWQFGLNNPCPAGFRVPTETEWETERASWSSKDSAGAFASPLKLVVAGWRRSLNGALSSAGGYATYWSSTVNGIYARSLLFGPGPDDAKMFSNERASGGSVRCIKD